MVISSVEGTQSCETRANASELPVLPPVQRAETLSRKEATERISGILKRYSEQVVSAMENPPAPYREESLF